MSKIYMIAFITLFTLQTVTETYVEQGREKVYPSVNWQIRMCKSILIDKPTLLIQNSIVVTYKKWIK